MRKIDILNKDYERMGLDIVVYTDSNGTKFTLRDIFEDGNEIVNGYLTDGLTSWGGYLVTNISLVNGFLKSDVQASYGKTLNTSLLDLTAGEDVYISYCGYGDSNVDIIPHFRNNTSAGTVYNYYSLEASLTTTPQIFDFMITIESNDANYYYCEPKAPIDYYMQNMILIKLSMFDTVPTHTELNAWRDTYLAIKNNTIESNKYILITNPTGFGNKYDMLSLDNKVYDAELNFENIKFDINFGINYNAYLSYKGLMDFLKGNKCIIEYDYGNGIRYADVRLKTAPKTEKQSNSLITQNFTFERLTPWYIINTDLSITNDFGGITIKPVITFTPTGPDVDVSLQRVSDSVFVQNVTLEDVPVQEIIIDCENKTVKFADGTSAYGYIDKTGNTFIEVPDDGEEYLVVFTATTGEEIEYKEWVID